MTKKGWLALGAAAAVIPLLLCVGAFVALTGPVAADQDEQRRQAAYLSGAVQVRRPR
ncbi:hypothetical protein ABZT51_50850 [Streptomyces sp. NPDC005373]|uniref:hypothetical protein n=1 Tax=Streptomyces sp. NPDC005373 TaxID=3156879 RepID=UPI0033A567BC